MCKLHGFSTSGSKEDMIEKLARVDLLKESKQGHDEDLDGEPLDGYEF